MRPLLKYTLLGLWLFCLGFQVGGRLFLEGWYLVDRDSFERIFCENLDKPQLECHGKCQLAKIQKEEIPPEDLPNRGVVKEPLRPVVFIYDLPIQDLLGLAWNPQTIDAGGISQGRLLGSQVFHPPKIA